MADREAIAGELAQAGSIEPELEAGELIAAAEGDRDLLADLVRRRRGGEPVAWLTGRTSFCGLDLVVRPGVYVPRPQTEPLAQRAAELLPPGGVAVDLCTGAGAIAAMLAESAPGARILATDLDPAAVACARENGVEALQGFLDEPLPRELAGRVDVLTAVPPYVPTDELRLLPSDVREFEPRLALDGGSGGTEQLAAAARRCAGWLRPGGSLLMELGGDQSQPVGAVLGDHGFTSVEALRDEEGDPRGVVARFVNPA